ncbi:hypothetical protein LAJ19_03445 [Deinococcus taeanensis]|uniref:hypothetical protein n=1 Tax=Deinococcus taeanensis TaxID=2737050 RepID=UPI001CDD3720|nr:hypothetical protein [Deinococcus taeanensis]UBV43282.1 hypothetical protein LAJ19_03445 [Deinococcus taeanensis]
MRAPRVPRALRFLPAAALALTLAGCAPQAATTVQSTTPVRAVSFYPREAGLLWSYLPEGDSSATPPYTLQSQGVTLFGQDTVHAYRMTGRGADQTWYRAVDATGVRLLGIRKPGVTVRLHPAWLEYPAEAAWRVGLTWQGQSEVTLTADDGTVQARGTLTYSYVVQERRQVTTPGGRFDVWVVARQITDTVGGLFPATQQLWFTPFIGEVRTPEGLLLTGRNFAPRPGGQP